MSQIDKANLDLPAVIGINGPRSVDHRDPMLDRQPAPGPDLNLVAGFNCYGKPGRQHFDLSHTDDHLIINRRSHIHASRQGGMISRRLKVLRLFRPEPAQLNPVSF